jgi:hypothetical protein
MQKESISEVARLREKIAIEHMASKLWLYGLNTGTARHPFITARQVRIGALHQELRGIVGDGAIALVAETMDAVPDDVFTRSDVLAALRCSFNNSEEVESLCNALREAWKTVDLLDEQTLVDLSSVPAFTGMDLLKERFGEQAHKVILAPSSVREIHKEI